MSNIILPSGIEDTGGGYTTQRSVRLRSAANGYLSRAFGAGGSTTTWTLSAWIKRTKPATAQFILGYLWYSGTGPVNNQNHIIFNASDQLDFVQSTQAGNTCRKTSTAVFRDTSAWYHIVAVWDSTNAVAADRMRLYVNGDRITSFATSIDPSSGLNSYINTAATQTLSAQYDTNGVLGLTGTSEQYMTEVNFINGQALLPTAFGEYDSVRNTQWKPKAYTGTYGTNGFYLKFADNSAATAAALGKDSSGNGNNWTPNGISLTAGATYDSMTDVPTLTSETAANFCTLSPVSYGANNTRTSTSNGNLSFSDATAANTSVVGTTFPNAGKWYFELSCTSTGIYSVGVIDPATKQESFYRSNGAYSSSFGGAGTTGYSTWTNGDVIGVAWDADAGKIWYAKNNVWQAGSPSSGTTPTNTFTANTALTCEIFTDNSAGTKSGNLNFGAGSGFTYTPPTGFKALNTYNLPEPAVASSDDYHKVYTYTGNGGGLQVGEIQKPMSLFNLDRSLRLRNSASAYLTRTPASAGNRQIFTWAAWVKRGSIGSNSYMLFDAQANGNSATLRFCLGFSADSFYVAEDNINTATNFAITTTQLFRDPSLWYHVVVAFDTTQATAANRIKLYVNGQQVTTFNSATYPALNYSTQINNTVPQYVGYYNNLGTILYYDGLIADMYLIDGQALDPTSFGQYDGNYYWTPKAYTGTYGTNGFHLEFEDFSASTAAAIGKDTSGQGNNWTPNNINLTTPANTNVSWDSMVDVPTSTSTDVANFVTANPLNAATGLTISDGNLKLAASAAGSKFVTSTLPLPASGMFYSEITFANAAIGTIGQTIGIQTAARSLTAVNNAAGAYLFYASAAGALIADGTTTASSLTTIAANETFQLAFDLNNNKMWIGRGNVWYNSTGGTTGDPSTGANPTFTGSFAGYLPYAGFDTASAVSATWNFGQRPFRYTPPTGFKSLNSYNVAEVTGDLESPDFVWIKSRSAGTEHALFNSVVGKGKYVRSSNAGAEVTDVNSLIQFNKNGFLLGNAAIVNASAATFVASAWKVAATTVTNTDGSITSQVRANPTSGISLITYTGIGSSPKTVGHGLGIAPKLVMVKDRNSAFNWRVWHASLAATQVLEGLNTTSLVSTQATFNNTVPTSTLISVGNNDSNLLGASYLMYAFAEIPGFSKFTSYAANASATDGPHVVCGFSPRWLMIKRATGASGTGGWIMYDTARSSYNIMGEYLFAEGAAGGSTLAAIDVTANGFKIRSNNVHLNQTSGDIYIVMAFAEHPFKYALAR